MRTATPGIFDNAGALCAFQGSFAAFLERYLEVAVDDAGQGKGLMTRLPCRHFSPLVDHLAGYRLLAEDRAALARHAALQQTLQCDELLVRGGPTDVSYYFGCRFANLRDASVLAREFGLGLEQVRQVFGQLQAVFGLLGVGVAVDLAVDATEGSARLLPGADLYFALQGRPEPVLLNALLALAPASGQTALARILEHWFAALRAAPPQRCRPLYLSLSRAGAWKLFLPDPGAALCESLLAPDLPGRLARQLERRYTRSFQLEYLGLRLLDQGPQPHALYLVGTAGSQRGS